MGLLGKFFKTKTPVRNKDTGTVVERYWKSFNHAIDGLVYSIKYEHNMIIIFSAAILVSALGLYLQISEAEWLFILFICGVIAACELINSSIEATIDLITHEIHPLAKVAKDTASAASLIFCTVAFIGACIIFIPKIF